MFVNRKLLGEMLGRWHSQADKHVALAMDNADLTRSDAKVREERLHQMVDAAQTERKRLVEAFGEQKRTLDRLLDEANRTIAALQSEKGLLQHQHSIAQNNFEWARVRLNSVEQERAVLIERVLAVSFPVPEMTREVGPAERPTMAQRAAEDEGSSLLRGLGLPLDIFEDVGDDAANAAGLVHEDDVPVVVK
jgi:chromosome segregation ATPase